MFKGLGRSPLGPRGNFGPTPGDPGSATRPPVGAPAGSELAPGKASHSLPPPPPAPPMPIPRPSAPREADPAQERYESLKKTIHAKLVDRLDLNRVSEMPAATLRNEIRGVVEQLCDAEQGLLLNASER